MLCSLYCELGPAPALLFAPRILHAPLPSGPRRPTTVLRFVSSDILDARMSRRHSVRRDDFLSESDLSTSSSESDRDAKVPYRDEDEAAPSTRRRKAVRDGHGSTDSEDDAASPVKQGYAAPPVLASSDESTEDEDEEKLMGLPRSSSKVKTKGKVKKQKRVWEMRSGPGAPAPGAAGGAPPKVSLSFFALTGKADVPSVQNNTACIAISIIIVVVVIAAAGIG